MANPTVVVGHINDEEIKKSIDSLVTHVNEGVSKMVQSFDGGIARIKKELESLGKFKIDMPDMGGSTTMGRSSGRASRQKEETQAVKETTAAYDEMARAMQMAANSKFAKYAISDAQRLQMEMHEVQRQMKDIVAPSKTQFSMVGMQPADITNLKEYDRLVKDIQIKIKELQGLNFKLVREGEMQQAQRVSSELRAWQRDLQYIQNQRSIWEKQQAGLDPLRAKLAGLIEQYNAMGRAMEAAAQQGVSSTQQATQAEQKYTDEIRKQAEIIRQSKEFQQTGRYAITTRFSDSDSMTSIVSSKSKLSIEEQLLNIYKEQEEARKRASEHGFGGKMTDAEIQAARERAAAAQQEADAQAKVTQQVQIQQQAQSAKKNAYDMNAMSYENLRQVLQSLTSTRNVEIQQIDQESASLQSLNSYLKKLTDAYGKLSTVERNSNAGKNLLTEIQTTKRAISELQKQMSRPISLDAALGGSEKTLDDIAYKIQRLKAYLNGLNFTNPNSKQQIDQVNAALDRLSKKQREVLGDNKNLMESNNALSRSWNYMKNRLAFYFTVGASTQFVRQLIDIRGQYEMTEKALGILVDSAERGTQIFNELSQMALVSPYTLIELSNAARQLTAYDVAAKDVVDTTRRLADMAAAVGIPIDRLTYALGQIKAYGYLNARDARMFANSGIPLVKALSDHYTELEGHLVSVADIYDRIKKKQIGYTDVMETINKMTDEGGKFFDFQAKMAETLRVQLANLTLAWNNMLNDIGASEQGLLSLTIRGLKELFLHWKDIDRLAWNVIHTLGVFKTIQFIQLLISGQLATKMGWVTLVGKRLTDMFISLGKAFKSIFTNPMTWWAMLAFAVVSAINAFRDANAAVKEFNESIKNAGKENFKNITNFLNQFKDIRDAIKKDDKGKIGVAPNVDSTEIKKAWASIREQIELSSSASNDFVGKLLSIGDINERMARGFEYLDKIQQVHGALQDLGDDTIKIASDWSQFWNLWTLPDSLIENFKDFDNELKNIIKNYGDLKTAQSYTNKDDVRKLTGNTWQQLQTDLANYSNQFDTFKKQIDDTTISMLNFFNLKGFDGEQMREGFNQTMVKILADTKLNAQEQVRFRIEAEKSFIEQRTKEFDDMIAYEKSKGNEARVAQARKEKDEWLASFGERRADADAFYDWLKRNHNSEISAMFGHMTEEEIKTLDTSKPEWRKWAQENAKSFSEQYGVSFDDLWSKIQKTNNMQIFIRLILGFGDEKTVYEQLTSADQKLADADKRVERLNARLKQLKKDSEEYKKTSDEISAAQKDVESALSQGGQRKTTKSSHGGAKKDPLGDALAKELQLIQDIQKLYKEYQKAGVDAQTAVTLSAKEYGKSLSINNAKLAKFGVNGLSGEELANMDLRSLREFYESILPKAGSSAKGVESLEKAIRNLNAEITKTDYKKITDGLNNELSKISDEYELGVQIQASPELGDIFTDMFNLNLDNLPMSIEDVVQRYQDAVDEAIAGALYGGADLDVDDMLDSFNLLTDDLKEWANTTGVEVSSELYKNLEKGQKDLRKLVEKNKIDIVKQTTDLRYKLADNAGKIAIAEGELARLQMRLYRETNEERRELLRLQIQDQENTIQKLKEEALQLLPFYANLFNGIADRSRARMRELINNAKEVTKNAKEGYNEKGEKVYTLTDLNGEQTTISAKKYQELLRRINKEEEKLETPWDKIRKKLDATNKDAFDLFGAIELIGSEAQKLGQIVGEIGDIAQELGADEATVEVINDVATSIEGVGTAAQGVAQIQAGDYLGGALNVIKGVWGTISSWFDNKNKKIDRQVKESERQVKRLELAYKDLEEAMNNAYGTATVSAKKAVLANKELQLVELRRQLALEKSRDSKKRDDDKIIDIQKQIKDLQYEINNSTMEIVNDLLGIGGAGDFAEDLVSSMIESFKKGEDYMAVFEGKFEDMVDNMIMKMIVSKVVSQYIDGLFENLDQHIAHRADEEAKAYADAQAEYDRRMNTNYLDYQLHESGWTPWDFRTRKPNQEDYLAWQEAAKKNADAAKKQLDAVSQITDSDLDYVLGQLGEIMPELGEKLQNILGKYYKFGQNSDSTLSALQQGIQGITEDTAGALEAYMNSVNQQVYYQSDILTQIRDEIVLLDGDAQLATNAQILLQLQQSYQIQLSIRNTLNDWSNASGRAVKVELIN